MTFSLDDKQKETLIEWMAKQKVKEGCRAAIGGRFQYIFTPHTIGTSLIVLDLLLNEKIDLTDYDSW